MYIIRIKGKLGNIVKLTSKVLPPAKVIMTMDRVTPKTIGFFLYLISIIIPGLMKIIE